MEQAHGGGVKLASAVAKTVRLKGSQEGAAARVRVADEGVSAEVGEQGADDRRGAGDGRVCHVFAGGRLGGADRREERELTHSAATIFGPSKRPMRAYFSRSSAGNHAGALPRSAAT